MFQAKEATRDPCMLPERREKEALESEWELDYATTLADSQAETVIGEVAVDTEADTEAATRAGMAEITEGLAGTMAAATAVDMGAAALTTRTMSQWRRGRPSREAVVGE